MTNVTEHILFITDQEYQTDDRNGAPCDLRQHLADLRKWGGTPDFFDCYESSYAALTAATHEAREIGRSITITDQNYHKIITVRAPKS